jgi:hypothetical protein
MSEPISVIDRSDIFVHAADPTPLRVVEPDHKFGIVKLNMKKTQISKTPTFFLFTVDKTGSMAERASSRAGPSTKMDFLISTFTKMATYLSEQDAEIYIQINTFNEAVEKLVEPVRLSANNLSSILDKIKDINADGSTNIGTALTSGAEDMKNYMANNPEHQFAHIFMSDGEPTVGERSHTVLKEMISNSYTNVFVGFGDQHNSSLFNKFCELKNSEYQFVDNLENTGMVYAEIIHQFLFPAIRNATISIENGALYDWQTNTWVSELKESVIVGEAEKIYHFKTTDNFDVEVKVSGTQDGATLEEVLSVVSPMPELMDMSGNLVSPTDLTKYMFRQRTQELLFISKTISKSGNHRGSEITSFKQALKTLFKKLRSYMRGKMLNDDPLLNMLCDDLSIVYRTCGTRMGEMYSTSRQVTQGRQGTYTASAIIDEPSVGEPSVGEPSTPRRVVRQNAIQDPPPLMRSNSAPARPMFPLLEEDLAIDNDVSSTDMEITAMLLRIENMDKNTEPDTSDSEDDLEQYAPSDANTSCYSTPRKLDMMRTFTK